MDTTPAYAIQTIQQDVPQIQTVIQDGYPPVTTRINADWANVLSVNGMTGDVIVAPVMQEFQANHYYQKDTAIVYNGQFYFAKANFTSGSTFDPEDWDTANFVQEQADWNEADTTANSYIKNKPSVPEIILSTTDIGEGADLPANTLYGVYEA